MGRSKFPGKPAKHGNRTRVSVLATAAQHASVSNAAAVAAAAAAASASAAVGAAAAAVSTNGNAPSGHPNVVAVGADDELDEDEERQLRNKTKTNAAQRPTRICRTRTQKKCSPMKKRARLLPVSTASPRPLTRSRVAPRRNSLSGAQLNRSLRRERLERKEPVGVGVFVLPSRSAHSSRVIKPNKRFISLDQQDTRIIRKRVKRTCNMQKTVTFADEHHEIEDVPFESPQKDVEEEQKDKVVTPESPMSPSPAPAPGKVLLRQPRLQLNPSKSPCVNPEGPFSVTTSSSPRTITCGVCGAVRFYRFVKNARKFNIFSCESCRKFISKLIKRTTITSASALSCLKGQGLCHVPPNVRSLAKYSQQYAARCPACWLKLCLKSFQIPMALKTSLTKLLPKYMQPSETANSLPLLSWQAQDEPLAATTTALPLTSPLSSDASSSSNSTTLRQRPVRLKQQQKQIKTVEKPPMVSPPVEIKRAKVDLKGPRVKHVCRSASIVLGQLPATFPAETATNSAKIDEKEEIPRSDEKLEKVLEVKKQKETIELLPTVTVPREIPLAREKLSAIRDLELDPQPLHTGITKKDKERCLKAQQQPPVTLSMLPMEITKPSFTKKCKKITQLENPNLLNIDFWENYDPDEIVCNGYGVISTEAFPMRAICFLCGSAGRETLVHCCVCCEPYHPYCLEQGPPKFQHPEHKFSWVCPKCTKCSACGEADRQKIHCQKCHKAYHPQCFNHKWRTDDRPTVCSNCLRCKSCGTDNITKFVGNLALCLACFKLRNKGNFCPLCQCCYDDNDFDTKMMECGKCNKWVHAKCEGLSDEHYQILSILPESVEFICCLCTAEATPFWRKAVQQELRSCLNNILRLMSKNRIAREAFKLTPLKAPSPHVYPGYGALNSARRLQFVDANERHEHQDVQDVDPIDTELEQVNATFKNKIDFGDKDSFNTSMLNDSKLPISPRMVEIKNKLNCNEYFSLHEFNESMETALASTSDGKLLEIYHSILKNVLPWFDPSATAKDLDTLDKTMDLDECEAGKTTYSKKCFEDFESEPFEFQSIETLDTRLCNLCKGCGDGLPEQAARLLYCGQNEWIHANCALWSSEVYEEIDGSLQNVQAAITRGRSIRCAECKQKGASVGCCLKGCHETYHFPCAQKVRCHFSVDRMMYCHAHDAPAVHLISSAHDFAIRRSVYIEVDTRKKKLAERERVQYMVGSLSVVALGKVIPAISDTLDAIIPVGFACSRLFWSTVEPWKLVPYKITTSVFNSAVETYVDRNFTVDHSLPKHIIERKLKEVLLWQKDDRERSDIYEFEDYEEPQNAGDILSPELTDAILEEIPHDLLEGLSMQEMLKEYEELMNLEFRNTEINSNDNLSLNMNDAKDDSPVEGASVAGIAGAANVSVRELKRSKSEVFQKIKDQNRSCSLAYLHLDNNLSPVIKKRKITAPFMQIVQVDGACDSGSECASPTHETEYQDQDHDQDHDPWAEDGNVKCVKCHCTYRTKISYERHLENCDAMFTSESETEDVAGVMNEEQQSQQQQQVIYESFSFQATAHAQNKSTSTATSTSTMMNTQTIMEAKMQDGAGGIIFNYQQQGVKPPGMDSLFMPATSTACIIPQQVLAEPMLQDVNFMNQAGAITIDAKMLPVLNLPQSQLVVRPQGQGAPLMQKRCLPKPRAVVSKRPLAAPQRIVQVLPQLPQISQSQPVILQNMNVLPFLEQNVQYVVAPQVSQQPTTQLVQLADNNYLSLVQNVPQMQPTMILPPRVDGQLMIDSNGAMIWAPPMPQVYYGIETVQTTVMQSHFLPHTMPGMMTTNSSYSATTQVFQTSKLEPCMDGSYVLVNQLNQNQLLNNVQVPNNVQVQQVQQVPQVQIQTSHGLQNLANLQIKPVAIQPQPQPAPQPVQQITIPVTVTPTATAPSIAGNPQTIPTSLPPPLPLPVPVKVELPPAHAAQPKTLQVVTSCGGFANLQVTTAASATGASATNSTTSSTNSITLPVAPFVPEHTHGIPTNIVTPTPKPVIPVQPARPMSRVLPMQTTTNQKKPAAVIEPVLEKTEHKITVLGDVIIPKPKAPQLSPTGVRKIPLQMEPQVTYKLEVKGRDMPLLSKDVKIAHAENNDKFPLLATVTFPPLDGVGVADKQQVKKIEKVEDKEAPARDKDKDVLKVNKIPVAPLRPIKTTTKLRNESSLQNTHTHLTANKENILLEGAHDHKEPKYSSKRPNTTSIFFKIESSDGFEYTATSLPQIWRKVFADVQAARASHNLPPLPDIALRAFNDLDILGLKTKGLRFLVEQLPDAGKCKQYKPLYHKPKDPYQFEDDDDEDSARRCVAYDNDRKKYDMFGWLSSKHRTLEMYDLDAILKKNASSSLPMAMRFRALRVISKYSVGVYRSDIHGRGLFSLRDIESGEMVIEYAGEVIRSVLTDKRERHYNTKGIGCYMFRIDDNLVVDATMKGNAARFINHSCDPNCYSKVVEILGNKHIIIFALRRIICGEELTYDYKFPFEEDKIPCSCGTRRCRKFLN